MKNAWKLYGCGSVLIILLTFLAYYPALKAGFVFDDLTLITQNPMVKASDGLHRFWFTTEAPDYYPLTWSFWWLEWRLWGSNPTGYHVVSVLLQAINAILVWMVLRRLKIPGAWAAGLVFAIHPVNVSTGAWISEQKNTLSMFFAALATLFYLHFDEGKDRRWFGFSLGAFLLALLSKTAVVMLPVALLGCVWWLRDRLRWKDVAYTAPFFILALLASLLTIWFQNHRALAGVALQKEGFNVHLAAAGWVPWFYLSKALLPLNLMLIYPRWQIDASSWISYLPGTILIGSLILFWRKRHQWGRPWLFGLGYFIVMLFPILGFFDQGFYRFSFVADHWQYYSIVAVIALVVAAGERIGGGMNARNRPWKIAVGLAVLGALMVATWRRAGVYANEETLWEDNVARNPNAVLAHDNLGHILWEKGNEAEAIGHWNEALRIKPNDASAHYNLGLALGQMGRTEEAIAQWEQALLSQPDFAEAHYNLGVALAQQGKVPEAMGQWEQTLQVDPGNAEAHYNLGLAFEKTGRIPEAINHYRQALQFKADYAAAQNALARLQTVR